MLELIDRMANNLWSNLDIPAIWGNLDLKLSGREKGKNWILVSVGELALDQQCAS